jgi:hypothetical protein
MFRKHCAVDAGIQEVGCLRMCARYVGADEAAIDEGAIYESARLSVVHSDVTSRNGLIEASPNAAWAASRGAGSSESR